MTCGRTQEYLARTGIETTEVTDARKRAIGAKEALALVKQVDEIYATKGRKIVHVDLRAEGVDTATLKGLLIGPSGNLRAPTLRVGRTLLVGFDAEAYRKVLGR